MRIPAALLLLALVSAGQDAPPNGPRKIDPAWHAIVGATVHVAPGKAIENATVVIRENRIAAVGRDQPPAGARTWNGRGLHVYAGFIDAHVAVDPEPSKPRHWNKRVTPRRVARTVPAPLSSELRALGFTAAAASPKSGIFRGRATLVSLAPEDPDRSVPRPSVYREDLYHAIGFERSRRGDRTYPTALMGAIAVVRQGLHDGFSRSGPLLFDCADELNALRAAKIAREFKRKAVLLGSGLEFRRLDAIKADGLPLVVPLRMPPPPKVDSVAARNAADLRELMTWETAPSNVRLLVDAGLDVSLTTSRLKKRAAFFKQLRETAGLVGTPHWLAGLTTNPARLLGVADRMGTVEPGKLANLCVWTAPPHEKKAKVVAVWIDGRRHEVNRREWPGLDGTWTLDGKPLRFDGKKTTLDKVKAARFARTDDRIDMVFSEVTYSGQFTDENTIRGHATRPDGTRFAWAARRSAKGTEETKKEPPVEFVRPKGYPFGPYALDKLPPQDTVAFAGGTIWTSGPQGILKDGQVEIKAGRIVYVGPRRKADRVFELGDRHLTPGIIDCHSHTGISGGVNDSGQAVTAEVRIGDVTNPDSISWYRQLASGVTCVNNLHGSANPIGGQSQTNKIRWGVPHPDQMHFSGAMPGIKFALGENVKQSNWGDAFTTRYPQTRMGVETLIRDRFLAAREYLKDHKRVDLELEALGEILQGRRLIHCHSYRQDEILMLCRIAQEFGFRIGTFQHILEGYKVADAIRENAIGASAFSDWWAYKVEVQDAIPENGAIMHGVGVNVSFNSDSDDLARRLNVEAAKAMKYGGLAPAEAFKFVTLNPAIQLGVAKRVGSLEVGKDADLVLWSGDPMSPYSICLSTWVDGRETFSIEADMEHRAHIAKERRRIIAKILKRPPEKERDKARGEAAQWWINRFQAAECGVCGVER